MIFGLFVSKFIVRLILLNSISSNNIIKVQQFYGNNNLSLVPIYLVTKIPNIVFISLYLKTTETNLF